MTIARRQIQSTIQSGNFGQPGTPLGYRSPRKGPDLGRLMKTLGVVADEVAGGMQKDNEAAAGAAVREVLIDTKGKSREERAAALSKVREDFEDQGLFLNAWTDENPAVRTIDKINGRAQAQTTKATLNNIMNNTAGEPLEVRQEKILAALHESRAFTEGLSEETKQSYLESITGHALSVDDNLVSQEAIRIREQNKSKVYNNYVLEGEEIFDFYSGQSSEAMNTDPAAFIAGQQAMDDEEAQSDMAEVITKTGKELYDDTIAVGGSKQEASEQLANYATFMAKKYSRPELIEHAMDIQISDGLKLKDVHGATLDKVHDQVAQARVRKQASFKQQAEIQRNKEFKLQYDTTYTDNQVMIQRAKEESEDTELTQEALTSLRKQREDLIATQDNYSDNPDHFGRMLKMLNHNEKDLESSVGDPMVEEEAMTMITKGTMNGDWYLTNSNKIDDLTKSKVTAYLDGERKASTANAAAHIKNMKILEANAIEAPLDTLIDNYSATLENSLTKLEIETLQHQGEIGKVPTGKDIRDAGWQAVRELDASQFEESGKPQAPHADRAKAYKDAVLEQLKQNKEAVLDKLAPKSGLNKVETPKIQEGVQTTNEAQSGFEKVFSTDNQDEITFDEAQALSNLPSESFETPAHERKARQVATTALIRTSPDITVEAAVRQVLVDMSKAGEPFDPSNKAHVQGLKDILVQGFGETRYKPKLAKGISRSHDPNRTKTLGVFLKESFDNPFLDQLIDPDQLGNVTKLREMLGASE